jgi:catechol 2,3-dioxygenase-like lactoylglutathione lyase family enzyme
MLQHVMGTLEALRRAGFEPEPRREHWGAPRCFVRDPAGHRVEIMAAPPP